MADRAVIDVESVHLSDDLHHIQVAFDRGELEFSLASGRTVRIVIPIERAHARIAFIGRCIRFCLQSLAQLVDVPRIRMSCSGCFLDALVPLQYAFGVRDRTLFFQAGADWQIEDLGLAFIGRGPFGIGIPDRSALILEEIHYHEPFEVSHRIAAPPRVGVGHSDVLADHHHAIHAATKGFFHGDRERFVITELREPLIAIFVIFGGVLAIVSFEQADHVIWQRCPRTTFGLKLPHALTRLVERAAETVTISEVISQGGVARMCFWLGDVVRQDIEQRGNIGSALHVGMSAERQDAATRTTDVAEQ